jgi:RloB-like protein
MAKRKTENSRSYSSRKLNIREPRQRFLIVCEGTKTEPNYFESFRVPKSVVTVKGVAKDPSGLVNHAKALADEVPKEDRYDQVWCVFDRDPGTDSWTAQNFNSARQKRVFILQLDCWIRLLRPASNFCLIAACTFSSKSISSGLAIILRGRWFTLSKYV